MSDPVRTARALQAALAWAKADRVADDRTAELWAIERVVARQQPPIPEDMVTARLRATQLVHEACVAEGNAELELKEAAQALLDGICADRESVSV